MKFPTVVASVVSRNGAEYHLQSLRIALVGALFGFDKFGQQIDEGHRLVTGRAGSAHAKATAKACAVMAILLSEVAAVARWALIDGRVSRCVRWYRRN
jgi:hypothetical protein